MHPINGSVLFEFSCDICRENNIPFRLVPNTMCKVCPIPSQSTPPHVYLSLMLVFELRHTPQHTCTYSYLLFPLRHGESLRPRPLSLPPPCASMSPRVTNRLTPSLYRTADNRLLTFGDGQHGKLCIADIVESRFLPSLVGDLDYVRIVGVSMRNSRSWWDCSSGTYAVAMIFNARTYA